MSYSLTFEIPGLPKSANARLHWRARYRENSKWRLAVAAAVLARKPKVPLVRAKLVCTRHSSVESDADNVVAGFKPVIDALVVYGVLANDKWGNIGMPEYRWEKAPAKLGKISVTVTEVL